MTKALPACRVWWYLCLVGWSWRATEAGQASTIENRRVTVRRVARVDGDIVLGALFPVHRQPPLKIAFTRQCGEIWEQYGMHRIEIFLRTLDRINQNQNILRGLRLGCDIRDSCWYPPVALEQSIDFIKNSIASIEKQQANKTGNYDSCGKSYDKPIAGLIGPGSSTVTIQIQNLLSLFTIPQIGYSATSKDLSDKSLYKYFLRVVPSDKLQARALVDIVRYYNWTYISTVYTEGNYGFSGMQEFSSMIKQYGICEASSDKVPNNADDSSYDQVIDNLKTTENARVVICFCEGMTVRGLLKASKRRNAVGQFLFIGSDGWAVRPDVVTNIEEEAVGGMSIKLYSPSIADFDKHYFSLRPNNNSRNPWFKEFWQERFRCYINGKDKDPRYDTMCTGDEDLSEGYVQDAKLGFVVNAITTMAYALDAMQRDLCHGRPGICPAMQTINGTIFMDYLLNVSFNSYSNDQIMFDSLGDPPGRYDIMNFQKIVHANQSFYYDYVQIGGWDSGNLTMNDNKIFWPNAKRKPGAPMVESVCSAPCGKGQVKIQRGGVHCCWACNPCKENEIVLDEKTCKSCPMGWWPNQDLNACMRIKIEHIQWGDTEAVVAMVFACVGIIITFLSTLVFVRHNNTPVVKASTRELSYIILFGITLSYLTSFPLVAKPSLFTCYLVRILPGFSFSLIYGALVTKTNRIARILAGSKKKIMTRKPRFMSACAQLVITFIIIGIESTVTTVMLILEPADSKLTYPTKTRVKLTCNATTMGIIVPLGFDILLIIMCTLYAIKTRNLPENFNEAKFIGFTMYTTCIIWLAFIFIYFGSDNKVITMCLAITLSATVALILLFFPKIYIIICKPEKNNRSAFTTSKDVRCHIGTTGRSYSTSNESMEREKSFEGAALSLYRQKNFFNRWKNKSLTGPPPGFAGATGKPPNGSGGFGRNRGVQPSSFRGYSSRVNSINEGPRKQASFRENIPLKDADVLSSMSTPSRSRQSSRRSRDAAESDLGGSRSSWASERTISTEGGGLDMRKLSLVDSSVQTDDDLLQSLYQGLRRRVGKTDSNTSSKSGGACARSPDDEIVVMSGRKSNSANRDKVLSPSYSSSPHQGAGYDPCETDALLTDGGHDNETTEHVLLHVEESSPLLSASPERLHFLSPRNGKLRRCDSTSEETLSDGHEASLEDIEDLLTGACSEEGSFGSLVVGELGLPFHQTTHNINVNKYQQPHDVTVAVIGCEVPGGGHQHISSSTEGGAPMPTSRTLEWEQNKAAKDCLTGSPLRSTRSAPALADRDVPKWSETVLTPYSAMAVPHILVQNPTPMPSDTSSSTESDKVVGEDGRRLSGESQASTGRTSTVTSQDELDTFPSSDTTIGTVEHPGAASSTNSDSNSKFQEYLRTRGLDLDLTSVQSSDV